MHQALCKRHDSTVKCSVEWLFLGVMQPSDKQPIPSTMKVSYRASVAVELSMLQRYTVWEMRLD